MRPLRRLSLLLLPASFVLVQACLGEDAASTEGGPQATTDGGGTGSVDGSSGTGEDGSSSTPTDGGGGGDVDAGPPPCGYAGEACCAAPSLPCQPGATCNTAGTKCMVNELRIAGTYYEVATNQTRVRAAKWNGSAWTFDANDVVDPNGGFSGWTARSMISMGPDRYRATVGKSAEGKMRNNTNGTWSKCEVGQSCVGPLIPAPVFSSVLEIGGDYWLAGSNSMVRCANGAGNCVAVKDGISGQTWGEGTLVGTVGTDIWYSALDRVLHFDGASWTMTPNLHARTIFQVSKSDIWIADNQFQHWDGAAWSAPMGISGAAAPGFVSYLGGSAKDDVWAVGDGGGAAFAAHWDGTKWSLVPMPQGAAEVRGLFAPSRSEVFVLTSTMLYRWTGTWAAIAMPPSVDGGAGEPNWDVLAGPAKKRP